MSGTRQKTLGEQLSQTWVAEGRGEALDAEAEDAEPLMAKPAPESPALAEQLMEEGRRCSVAPEPLHDGRSAPVESRNCTRRTSGPTVLGELAA